jgi:hypothetical protein
METTTKRCPHCGIIKAVSEFRLNRANRDGLNSWCKTCGSEANKASVRKNPIRRWASSTLRNHKAKGVEILISIDDLEEYAKHVSTCQICGTTITYGAQRLEGEVRSSESKEVSLHSATLDRKSNETNLTKGNIGIICMQCNMMKGKGTIDQMYEHALRILASKSRIEAYKDDSYI